MSFGKHTCYSNKSIKGPIYLDNYGIIIKENLNRLYKNLPAHLEQLLPGQRQNDRFILKAFGCTCCIGPDDITLDDEPATGVIGILISLYALHASQKMCIPTPYKAYRELPNSMPYVGAFASHTELILIPYIDKIEDNLNSIFGALNGETGSGSEGGDIVFTVRPLPKIKLKYIFYLADDDFTASATCLFSNNALSFLPIDALADMGEYTSKKIIDLVNP